MNTPSLRLYALCACCVVIAACSQTTELSRFQFTPNFNSLADRGVGLLSYRVLHSFGAVHDGNYPNAGLIYVGDSFYGTTTGGGLRGKGTVFSVTTSGAEKVLHSFGGTKTSGRAPYGGLVDVGGTFYGTTEYGGAFDDGTVFTITPDDKEKLLYSFGKGTDGYGPSSVLLDAGGTLYGTTSAGGTNFCPSSDGCGTVFSITTSGKEKVLHNFGKGTDGRFPDAGLIEVHGTLYGTTYKGGTYGLGMVFGITTGGKEKVLHSFGPGNDGENPGSGLIDVKGRLYGTTPYGGTHNGSGTLFSVTTSGKERVLHNFGKGADGSFPYGSLIDVGGTLYGTTGDGGAYGFGTLFSATTGGTEKVLHDFRKGTDGNTPLGDLTYKGGSFVGTAIYGGPYGDGVVFSLTP
ncbi:MAG: choice-of-anchor tandem repeat GloVer-containing protein [Candidatus Cybelea sp.]